MRTSNLLSSMVLGCLLMLPFMVWSQATLCPNLYFSYGTMQNWQCYAGSCANGMDTIYPTQAISGIHTIMNLETLLNAGTLYDENCQNIEKVPKGYSFSCRLGNDSAGSKVNAIEYEMTVDNMSSFLVLCFAWVMQKCSGHTLDEQPQFTMKIKDSAGNILDISCGNLSFTAQDSMIPNLACDTDNLVASNWNTVGFNLEQMIGQTIKIYFETRDCSSGCHFGYAYVVGECRPARINVMYCSGYILERLRAPDGFVSYKWTRSDNPNWTDTRQQVSTINPADSTIFTCVLTSELGCECELSTMILVTKIDANFMFGVKDENGHVDFDSHNNQSWYDTCSRTVTFVDRAKVYNYSKKSSIEWYIQELNVTSRDSLFTYTFPDSENPITYSIYVAVAAENGCYYQERNYITIVPSVQSIQLINPHFTTAQKVYCNNTNIAFTNKTNVLHYRDCYPDLIYEWDWGDGSKETKKFASNTSNQIIEHQYNLPNKETEVIVTLRVKTTQSDTGIVYSDTLTIIRPSIADFTDDGHIFSCPDTNGKNVNFTAISDGNIIYYTWILGDSYCDPNDNTAEGKTMTAISHVYKKFGYYTVTLVVQDSIGCIDTMRKENHVFMDGPIGTVSYAPLSGCVPLTTVKFTPAIVTDPNAQYGYTVDSIIYSPDGAFTTANTRYQVNNPFNFNTRGYTSPGMYYPHFQLIKWVTNPETGQKERCVVEWSGVEPIWAIDLKPDFIVDDLYGLNVPVEFENMTTVSPTLLADSIYWDFGNSESLWIYNTGTESHNGYTTYNTEDTYRVTLTEYYKLCYKSTSYDIEVSANLGIANKNNVNTNIVFSPNPVSTVLHINRASQEIADYTIYNVVGQMILQGKLQEASTINVESLASGMYYLRISDEENRVIIKIIKS